MAPPRHPAGRENHDVGCVADAASERHDAGDRFGTRCGEKHTHRIPDHSCVNHAYGASQQALNAFERP
ncbi:hypothetical protein DF143_33200 [Burkholderia cenocepacia]|nr:hypothetical protein DF143_33200 [Burkholderia cenocepacia]RQV48141.1 hypothetical protein DF033_09470 [Burkholderia cenocepacia]